jgi:hypothetical protein
MHRVFDKPYHHLGCALSGVSLGTLFGLNFQIGVVSRKWNIALAGSEHSTNGRDLLQLLIEDELSIFIKTTWNHLLCEISSMRELYHSSSTSKNIHIWPKFKGECHKLLNCCI